MHEGAILLFMKKGEPCVNIAVNNWFEVGPSTLEGMARCLLHTHIHSGDFLS